MAELKREVRGEIEANLVPPPQQNVWGDALKSVIQADAAMQQNRLIKEQGVEVERQVNEGLQAQIEALQNNRRVENNQRSAGTSTVFSDTSNNKQGGGDVPLTEVDQQDIADIRKSMEVNANGFKQGATTHTESLINQELILKRAIQRRPWLRDEFIKASTGFLGVDVYQRGYMALAENEAARLTANDAAAREKAKADEERGKAIREGGFINTMLSANPNNTALAQRLYAIQYDNAAIARAYDELIGTPEGENYRLMDTTVKSTNSAAKFSKDSMEVESARIAEFTKGAVTKEFEATSQITGDILNDQSLWDADGTILPEKQPILQARLNAMQVRAGQFEVELIAKGVPADVAKSYGDAQRASIDRLLDTTTGAIGEKITRARLQNLETDMKVSLLTQPAVSAVAAIYIRQGITDPGIAGAMAMQAVGANAHNSSMSLKHLTGPNAGAIATMLKEQARIMQEASSPNDKLVAKDALRALGMGTVVNLSGINSDEMAKTASAIGQARMQLQDFSYAFMATSNVGDKPGKGLRFFDELSEKDQQDLGGAFAKSVYTMQAALVKKTEYYSGLANVRKNQTDGTSVLSYGSDGSIRVNDPSAFTSPQELAYLAEIRQHNAFIERAHVGEIITNTLGRAPVYADRVRALATNFGVSGIAGASKLAITQSYATIYGRDEGGAGKKPQGAQAPREAPIGIRNNNPGNLRTGENGAFGTYPTMRDGIKAAEETLMAYQRKYGINTIKAAISRWAPREDNNDTDAYINHVVRVTGFTKDQPLDFTDKATRRAVLMAMFEMENGPKWNSYWQ